MPEGADQLRDRRLTERQKVNLSHWIHDHNIRHQMFDKPLARVEDLLELDEAWVVDHRDCEPSPEDRMLNFLRELIRSDDAGVPPDEADRNLLKAAGGCRHDGDLQELLRYAINEDWLGGGGDPGSPFFPRPNLINLGLGARIQVDEQLRARGGDQQAVVPDPAGNESEFTIPNIRNLPIDAQVVPIIEARLDEARRALGAGAYLSVIFLCGSVLEGVLLGAARHDPAKFNQVKATPKTKNGSPKPFHDWSLVELIDVACEIDILKLDVKKFSHELRDFRNYIHPYEQMKSGFTPGKYTAKVCFQVLEAALANLAGER